MKTLLLTSAVALSLTGTATFADHNNHQDGQDRVAYDGGFNSGFNTGYGVYNPQWGGGYAPVNRGWASPGYPSGFNRNVGFSGYNGFNSGYGFGSPVGNLGWSGYGQPNFGCGTVATYRPQPQILPGGCYGNGSQVYCPQNPYPRIYEPWSQGGSW